MADKASGKGLGEMRDAGWGYTAWDRGLRRRSHSGTTDMGVSICGDLSRVAATFHALLLLQPLVSKLGKIIKTDFVEIHLQFPAYRG
mgnify:CR=1 FL=1